MGYCEVDLSCASKSCADASAISTFGAPVERVILESSNIMNILEKHQHLKVDYTRSDFKDAMITVIVNIHGNMRGFIYD